MSLATLVARIESSIAAGQRDWAAECGGAFGGFLREAPSVAASKLNEILRAIDADGAFQSAGWDFRQLVLAEGKSWVLLCSLFEEPLEHIYSSPVQALVGVLGPATLVCDRYRLPPTHRPAVLDTNETLSFEGTSAIRPFEYFVLDGATRTYDFHAFEPTLLVRLFLPRSDALHHIYDRATLHPWLAQAGDPASTQIVCLLQALALLGDMSSVAHVDKASRHPHHFVRWAAIQAMSCIDAARAGEQVRAALGDEHPDIQDAARRSVEILDRIQGVRAGRPWR